MVFDFKKVMDVTMDIDKLNLTNLVGKVMDEILENVKIEEPYFTNLNFTVLMQELYFRNWWLAIINPSERRLYIDERPYMDVRLGWAD